MRSYFRYLPISRSSGSRFARMFPCEMTTPRGSAVVPEVKTICTMSSRVSGGGVTGASERAARCSRAVFPDPSEGTPGNLVVLASRRTASRRLARRCAAAKSAAAILSMGTTMAPRSRHPKKAATHSAQFSPQMQHLVALADAARLQFAREAVGTCSARRRSSSAACGIRGDGRKRSRERGGESCRGNPGWWCGPSIPV